VGAGQHPPEGIVAYRLGDAAATRRALTTVAVGAVASLAAVIFAVVLLAKLAPQPTSAFWLVAAALALLLVARALIAYGATRSRLRALTVTVSEDQICSKASQDACAIGRAQVRRIVEVDGALGGIRVESHADPDSGVVSIVQIPRGGEAFGDVRDRLERWVPIERRERRGPAVRFGVGAVVVMGIFFVPFLLDDFVARSKLVAAGLVAGMWVAMRAVLKRG
jgi:hypothetical protein